MIKTVEGRKGVEEEVRRRGRKERKEDEEKIMSEEKKRNRRKNEEENWEQFIVMNRAFFSLLFHQIISVRSKLMM